MQKIKVMYYKGYHWNEETDEELYDYWEELEDGGDCFVVFDRNGRVGVAQYRSCDSGGIEIDWILGRDGERYKIVRLDNSKVEKT